MREPRFNSVSDDLKLLLSNQTFSACEAKFRAAVASAIIIRSVVGDTRQDFKLEKNINLQLHLD